MGLGHSWNRTSETDEPPVSARNLDGRIFIAADARVDARDQLRARLRDRDRDLAPDAPDAELILHAYDVWGEGCFERLLGDFSFCLWDPRNHKLVCAVDHLGVKPIFYADRGGTFVASNSLEVVRLHPQVRDELNETAVGDFILIGTYLDRDATIDADVSRIPPGHFIVVADGAVRLQRYFTLPEPLEVPWQREQDCVERFVELFGEAVNDRLRSADVAIYMSGGIDSPLVALTAKRQLERRFSRSNMRAFTCVYDSLVPDDERRFTTIAARSLGVALDVQACDDGNLFDWVGRISPPQPFAGGLAGPGLDQVSRLARDFSVVLTGYDGDTLFSAAVRLHWRERLRQGDVVALGRELMWYVVHERRFPPIGARTLLARARQNRQRPRRPAWLNQEFWRRSGLEQRWAGVLDPVGVTRSREPAARGFMNPAWGGLFESYDPGYLGHPLDVRHPFADLRVIRFGLGLAAVPWCVNKHLARRCLEGLPDAIRRRPKTPLAVDPLPAVLRKRGIDWGRVGGQTPRAFPFLDASGLARSLTAPSTFSEDVWVGVRALEFSVWLADRRGRPEGVIKTPV